MEAYISVLMLFWHSQNTPGRPLSFCFVTLVSFVALINKRGRSCMWEIRPYYEDGCTGIACHQLGDEVVNGVKFLRCIDYGRSVATSSMTDKAMLER